MEGINCQNFSCKKKSQDDAFLCMSLRLSKGNSIYYIEYVYIASLFPYTVQVMSNFKERNTIKGDGFIL